MGELIIGKNRVGRQREYSATSLLYTNLKCRLLQSSNDPSEETCWGHGTMLRAR
jgi:hypothetical protein